MNRNSSPWHHQVAAILLGSALASACAQEQTLPPPPEATAADAPPAQVGPGKQTEAQQLHRTDPSLPAAEAAGQPMGPATVQAGPPTGPALADSGQHRAPAQSQAQSQAQAKSDSGPTVAEEPGIESVSIRPTAGGYMLDYRYRITDPEKALAWLTNAAPPYLEIPESGERLMVPSSGKVGPLRQQMRPGSSPKVGSQRFVLFANPGQKIRSGQVVRVVLGQEFDDFVVVR